MPLPQPVQVPVIVRLAAVAVPVNEGEARVLFVSVCVSVVPTSAPAGAASEPSQFVPLDTAIPAPGYEMKGIVQAPPRAHTTELIVVEALAKAELGIGLAATDKEGVVVEFATLGTSHEGQLLAKKLETVPFPAVPQVPSFIRKQGLVPEKSPVISPTVALRAVAELRFHTSPGELGNVAEPPPSPAREKLYVPMGTPEATTE